MSRALKRIRLIYKRVEPVYNAQEVDLRVRWINIISGYLADQIIFLDETVCSGRTANRRLKNIYLTLVTYRKSYRKYL